MSAEKTIEPAADLARGGTCTAAPPACSSGQCATSPPRQPAHRHQSHYRKQHHEGDPNHDGDRGANGGGGAEDGREQQRAASPAAPEAAAAVAVAAGHATAEQQRSDDNHTHKHKPAAAAVDHHHHKPSKANISKLSFADDIEVEGDEQDGGGGSGGGGGGLRAATADRFRQEKRAASQQLRYPGAWDSGGGGGGEPRRQQGDGEGGGGDGEGDEERRRGQKRHRLLVLEDDEDDDYAGGGGCSASYGGASPPSRPTLHAGRPSLGRIHFGSATARGMRPYMEDRHCIVASMQLLSMASGGGAQPGAPLPGDGVPRSYAAIFDGHNGTVAADIAAARLHVLLAAHPALRSHTGEPGPPAVARAEEVAIGSALRAAFGTVDEAALSVARREGTRDGATALVVMRLGQVLYAAHAGDSRAVLCRDGSALRLTEDHKPHLPRERARIEGAGGRVDFQRCWRVVVEARDGRPGSGLAVSRSLGDLDFKEPLKFVECEPDVLRLPVRPLQPSGAGDAFVILGSDGLWDVMSDDDAVEVAKSSMQSFNTAQVAQAAPSPATGAAAAGDARAKAAAEALLHESLRRGTGDNVTVVVMLMA